MINTDGSKNGEGFAGIGGICRDHTWRCIFALAQAVGRASSNMAEAKVALAGIKLCSHYNMCNIILECDSLLVIDMIKGKSTVPW